jgi:hypothetical protein
MQDLFGRGRAAQQAVREHRQHVSGRTRTGEQGGSIILLWAAADVLCSACF